ncbi:uncharacterized protein LOC132952800 isoform X2 [Metopolophium dirhodum]|nr:uncharacterized protein LOC132952800 isoform X2 [Metopolophium dirhodum]XP_060881220.1 uncharacterized protein LOC132952800 isoform X2 [Metopolophium dirhodum]
MSKTKAEECDYGVTTKAKQNQDEYFWTLLRSSKQQDVIDTIQEPWPAPKTNAERCRAYRARQKAARQQNSEEVIDTIQEHLVEEGSSHGSNLQQTKTSSKRVHAYRARQKNKDNGKPRPTPKTNAEYCLAYRARQKAARQQNLQDVIEIIQENLVESDGLIVSPNSQQQNSINMRQMDLDFIAHRNNGSDEEDEGSNENQPNVIVVHAEGHRDSLQSIARTSTERVQAYRARQRENLNSSQSKSKPKTVAERVREYRQRQRKKLHGDKNQTHNIDENNDISEDEDDGELIVKWCMNMIKGNHNIHFM